MTKYKCSSCRGIYLTSLSYREHKRKSDKGVISHCSNSTPIKL